jgi:5,10-methenyltetrahydrofolate synthetase
MDRKAIFAMQHITKPGDAVNHRREAIRHACLSARKKLPSDQVASLSMLLNCQLLQAFPVPPGKRIAFCWPMYNEPDARFAIERWRSLGAEAALPVTVADESPLVFRRWLPEMPLYPDRFGIPAPGEAIPLLMPNVILLPLNAFDAAGYRLGYGGGFFDRTIAAMTAMGRRPMVIGLGFELGRVADVLPRPHDEPLDWLVTEAGANAMPGRIHDARRNQRFVDRRDSEPGA